MSDDSKYDNLTPEELYQKIIEFEREVEQLKIQLEEERYQRQLTMNRIYKDVFDTEWGTMRLNNLKTEAVLSKKTD